MPVTATFNSEFSANEIQTILSRIAGHFDTCDDNEARLLLRELACSVVQVRGSSAEGQAVPHEECQEMHSRPSTDHHACMVPLAHSASALYTGPQTRSRTSTDHHVCADLPTHPSSALSTDHGQKRGHALLDIELEQDETESDRTVLVSSKHGLKKNKVAQLGQKAKQTTRPRRGAAKMRAAVKEKLFSVSDMYNIQPNNSTNAIILALGNVYPECAEFRKKVDTIVAWFQNQCVPSAKASTAVLAANPMMQDLVKYVCDGMLGGAVDTLFRYICYLQLALHVTSLQKRHGLDNADDIWRLEKLDECIGRDRFRTFLGIGTMLSGFSVHASTCRLYRWLQHVLEDITGGTRPDVCYQVCEIIRTTGMNFNQSQESNAKHNLVTLRLFPSLVYIARRLTFSFPTYDLLEESFLYAHDVPKTNSLFQKVCSRKFHLPQPALDNKSGSWAQFATLIMSCGGSAPTSRYKLGNAMDNDEDVHYSERLYEMPQNTDPISQKLRPAGSTSPEREITKCKVRFTLDELERSKPPMVNEDANWTRRARLEVTNALEGNTACSDMDVLQTFFDKHQLPDPSSHPGSKEQCRKYIKLDRTAFRNRDVRIDSSDDQLLALIFSGMPDHIKSAVFAQLLLINESEFVEISSREMPQFEYTALHCDWYYRYAENGEQFPHGIHPARLQREHAEKNHRVSYRSLTVHTSAECIEHHKKYEALCQALKPLFDWVATALSNALPEEYRRLENIAATCLPLHAVSPCHPFTGFVLNLSVTTRGHRDPMDFDICMVVPIGAWNCGELVLYELGLVLDLDSCDVVIFKSALITHFNLDVQGFRASLVLHTDRELLRAPAANKMYAEHGIMNC